MAAVIGGYTLLQLAELIASSATATKTIIDIHNELQAQGHPPNAPIPLDASKRVRAALASVLPTTPWAYVSDDPDHAGGA
jgi:hypothetical protein